MKKYIKLIPLIVYPYAYFVYIVLLAMVGWLDETGSVPRNISFDILTILSIIYNIYVLVISIYNTVMTARGKYSAYEASKMNLIVKACQVPAYIFHFIMGICGALLGIFGIGFLFLAIVVDVLTILLTGINSIGCSIQIKKEGILSTGVTILLAICSFIFCVDMVAAIIYVVLSKKNQKKCSCKMEVPLKAQ